MNEEKFENWKTRFLNEISGEEYERWKDALQNAQNADQLTSNLKKEKNFYDYFNRIEGIRWENDLTFSQKERADFKAYFKELDQQLTAQKSHIVQMQPGTKEALPPPFKPWMPFLLGTLSGGMAASLLFLAFSGLSVFQPNQSESDLATNTLNLQKENPELDYLINNNHNLGESIRLNVLLPQVHGEHSNRILFKWEYEGDKDLELEIFNNQNESISHGVRFILKPQIQEFEIVTTSLKPGLYYWKIIHNGELIDINKFFIE